LRSKIATSNEYKKGTQAGDLLSNVGQEFNVKAGKFSQKIVPKSFKIAVLTEKQEITVVDLTGVRNLTPLEYL